MYNTIDNYVYCIDNYVQSIDNNVSYKFHRQVYDNQNNDIDLIRAIHNQDIVNSIALTNVISLEKNRIRIRISNIKNICIDRSKCYDLM